MKILLGSLLLVLAASGHQTALAEPQTTDQEIGGSMSQEQQDKRNNDTGGFGMHFQAGFFYRLAGSAETESVAEYLGTLDFSWSNWSRTESTWGGGIHLAFDEDGYRIGLKGLWRTPAMKGTNKYFQVAPGFYLWGNGDFYEHRVPGFFLEAELGLAREFALVATVEALRYEYISYNYGYDPGQIYYPSQETKSGTATSLFVGAKAGQMGAVVLTIVGLIIGGVTLATMDIGFGSS